MLTSVFWALALIVLVTTALPLTNSARWWVRMWDFPRLHIAIFALIVFLAALPVDFAFKRILLALLCVAFIYQAKQIFPYTPFAKTEVNTSDPPSPSDTVTMLAVNVLMENDRYDDLITIIRREDPDILFLMETDKVWGDALAPVLARYDEVKAHLTNDHYGLIFATRLDVEDIELQWPDKDDTPAIKAVLRAQSGVDFNFIGLHPRPPVPGNDTKARDQQIKDKALMTSSADRPTVCMGDFNDVAWSWTTKRFKRYGNFAEPRVGRGMISSFHANHSYMRLPIDQLFITDKVRLVSFARLENFGSDHFPITATVFFDTGKGAHNDG
ncbi:endonuclease/exonuclease/phosphatase family protein [Sulfitobacter sp. F26169L]|uniref:endonuclease/exonuclease/phosphatase family protein n=1 Tax=Sulfitobacter sp. F26169L TaxID=2996015 RepID=UPI00226099D3|nr:endonuclease/exonuclease/phosphatase family protein [Sulfitobacter sp. F26169L]MCX7567718.1 endonuclease/exonuclease/phosphatase family protein [Sulfitobacter sp. F26169L]